jgi:hypothetical protein
MDLEKIEEIDTLTCILNVVYKFAETNDEDDAEIKGSELVNWAKDI